MKKMAKRLLCMVLALMLVLCIPSVGAASNYRMTGTRLTLGSNAVTATVEGTSLYLFKPTRVGYYRVSVDAEAATLSYWYGTAQYVSQPADEVTGDDLIVTCTAVGQTLLVGLTGVESATLTIASEPGYVAPPKVVYTTYRNQHNVSWRFSLPNETLTAVDITKSQTLVADSKGIYHLNKVDGPIVYVNMRASRWTDLYKLFYPDDVEGEEWPPIDVMRGRYDERNGKIYCYEFVEAMYEYADALDYNGYYYLTVDLAKYMQFYGKDQGWYVPEYSPFDPIKEGKFIQESAWLVNTYYVAPDVALGDVNGDGKVNNRDLAALQQYLNEWPVSVEMAGADVNGDGRLNNRDLAELQKLLNA